MFMFFWFIDIYVATSITLKKSEETQLNVYMYLNLAPMKIPYWHTNPLYILPILKV